MSNYSSTDIDTISDAISSLNPRYNLGSAIYHITDSTNWYNVKPYAFRFVPRDSRKDSLLIFLPINPSNITVTTHFATNIISTLYAVVEEHSEVRFFDITIQGTTGYAPRYKMTNIENNGVKDFDDTANISDPMELYKKLNANNGEITAGRSSMTPTELIPSDALGGYGQKTIGTVNSIASSVTKLFGLDPKESSGVDIYQSGYVAFHNLFRAFMLYKQDVSFSSIGSNISGMAALANPSTSNVLTSPLTFMNYKDQVKYSCAVQTFSMVRSAESPMLYNYSIVLRAYNLQPIGKGNTGTTPDKLSMLGLNNVSPSLAYRIREKAALATTAVAGIASLPSGFGA